jgi:DNA polymerase-1
MHIPIIEVAGYEADDLIELLQNKPKSKTTKFYGDPIRILLNWSENIFMYKPARIMGLRFGVFLRF